MNRDFAPPAPDPAVGGRLQHSVAAWAGTAYTAFVIDAFARLIAGWRAAASQRALTWCWTRW